MKRSLLEEQKTRPPPYKRGRRIYQRSKQTREEREERTERTEREQRTSSMVASTSASAAITNHAMLSLKSSSRSMRNNYIQNKRRSEPIVTIRNSNRSTYSSPVIVHKQQQQQQRIRSSFNCLSASNQHLIADNDHHQEKRAIKLITRAGGGAIE